MNIDDNERILEMYRKKGRESNIIYAIEPMLKPYCYDVKYGLVLEALLVLYYKRDRGHVQFINETFLASESVIQGLIELCRLFLVKCETEGDICKTIEHPDTKSYCGSDSDDFCISFLKYNTRLLKEINFLLDKFEKGDFSKTISDVELDAIFEIEMEELFRGTNYEADSDE